MTDTNWLVEVVYRHPPSEDEVVIRFGPMPYAMAIELNEHAQSEPFKPLSGTGYYTNIRHEGDEGPGT